MSAIRSSQVGNATRELHARLTKLDENWKNNEIAEKIKQQKQADLAVLQNRWKNGVLNDEVGDRSAASDILCPAIILGQIFNLKCAQAFCAISFAPRYQPQSVLSFAGASR